MQTLILGLIICLIVVIVGVIVFNANKNISSSTTISSSTNTLIPTTTSIKPLPIISNIIEKISINSNSYSSLMSLTYINNTYPEDLFNRLRPTSSIKIEFNINNLAYSQSSVNIGNVIDTGDNSYVSDFELYFNPRSFSYGIIHEKHTSSKKLEALQQINLIDSDMIKEGTSLNVSFKLFNFNNVDKNNLNLNYGLIEKTEHSFCNTELKLTNTFGNNSTKSSTDTTTYITWYDNINLNNLICYKGRDAALTNNMTIENFKVTISL